MKVMSPLSYHKPLNSSVNILVYYVQPMHINTHKQKVYKNVDSKPFKQKYV